MSNVRPHAKCKSVCGELRVALQGQRALEPVASVQRFASSLVFAVLEAALRLSARCETGCDERVNRIQVSRCQPGTLRQPVRWRAAHLQRLASKFKSFCPGSFPLRSGWLAESLCRSRLQELRCRHISRAPQSIHSLCGLTLRSSGPPPAWPASQLRLSFRLAGQSASGPSPQTLGVASPAIPFRHRGDPQK
jgi:hypothetical protein